MRRVLWLALALSACAEHTPDTQSPRPSASATTPVAETPRPQGDEAPPLPACSPDPRSEIASTSLAERNKALTALESGEVDAAANSLRQALSKRPTDLAAFAFSTAVAAEVVRLQEELGKAAESIRPLAVPGAAPPHKLLEKTAGFKEASGVTLKKLVQETHEGDLARFLEKRKIPSPFSRDPDEDQESLPPSLGDDGLMSTFKHGSHVTARYGHAIVLVGQPGIGMRAVDFMAVLADGFHGVLAPDEDSAVDPQSIFVEVRYAEVVGPLLVVLLAHEGDGLDAKPDGLLVAFDLAANRLAWISDAGVATGHSFYATGNVVVSSGGTVAPEYDSYGAAKAQATSDAKLYVLDLATGKTLTTMPLLNRADYVLGQGKKVIAWDYQKAQNFELSEAAPVPKPLLGSLTKLGTARQALPRGEATRCWLRNAAVALDHRDGAGLKHVANALPVDSGLGKGLGAAADFLLDRKAGRRGIDLTEKEPIAVAPSEIKVRTDAPKKAPAVQLVSVKDPGLSPNEYEDEPRALQEGKKPSMQFPINFWPGQRTDFYPSMFGVESLGWAYLEGDDVFLQYGQRYVSHVKDDALVKTLDFMEYAGPHEGSERPLVFITLVDGVLYVQTEQRPGDRTSGFFAALDPSNGKTFWRTEAGLLGRQPIIFQDHIVVAQSRGELWALDRHSGRTVGKVALGESPTEFGFEQRLGLFANTSKGRKYFALR